MLHLRLVLHLALLLHLAVIHSCGSGGRQGVPAGHIRW